MIGFISDSIDNGILKSPQIMSAPYFFLDQNLRIIINAGNLDFVICHTKMVYVNDMCILCVDIILWTLHWTYINICKYIFYQYWGIPCFLMCCFILVRICLFPIMFVYIVAILKKGFVYFYLDFITYIFMKVWCTYWKRITGNSINYEYIWNLRMVNRNRIVR